MRTVRRLAMTIVSAMIGCAAPRLRAGAGG